MSDITYPAPDGPLPGHLAVPAGAGPWPAVVVVHEAFGLTDDIRSITDGFAERGYLALAPQLFARGSKPACLVSTFRSSLTGTGPAVQDLVAARDFLRNHPAGNGKVGVIGFCMGGGFALVLAGRGIFDASAPAYGRLPKDLTPLRGSCPMVASYGARDRSIPVSGVTRLTETLAQAGVPHDVKVYPEAGHSFMNQDRLGPLGPVLMRVGVGYSAPEAADAFARVDTFFAEHLAAD